MKRLLFLAAVAGIVGIACAGEVWKKPFDREVKKITESACRDLDMEPVVKSSFWELKKQSPETRKSEVTLFIVCFEK